MVGYVEVLWGCEQVTGKRKDGHNEEIISKKWRI